MSSKREEYWGFSGPSHWDESISFETPSYGKSYSNKNKYLKEGYKSSYSSYSIHKETRRKKIKEFIAKKNNKLPKKPNFMKNVIEGLSSLVSINSVETLKEQNDRIKKITSDCKNIYL